ncbi:MAG: hypothetical protein AAF683_14590, partial [Pseudomonadota bacterium]
TRTGQSVNQSIVSPDVNRMTHEPQYRADHRIEFRQEFGNPKFYGGCIPATINWTLPAPYNESEFRGLISVSSATVQLKYHTSDEAFSQISSAAKFAKIFAHRTSQSRISFGYKHE